MTDPKKVTNPLFNLSVTGGTIEDFSQNALLLPAKEKPPPIQPGPISNINVPEQSDYQPQNFFVESSNIQAAEFPAVPQGQFDYQNPPIQQIDLNEETPQTSSSSNLSSVFSSFSNILKLKGSGSAQVEELPPVPLPAGLEGVINQEVTNIEPVPLFPSLGAFTVPNPTPPQGPVNTFRRTGLKRPVYAQVPGLSSSVPSTIPSSTIPSVQLPPPVPAPSHFQQPPHGTGYFDNPPPAVNPTILPEYRPTPTISPAHSVSSTHQQDSATPPSYFKPISPQPPTTFFEPIPTVFTPTASSPHLFPNPPSQYQSPVMAAVSPNEIIQPNEPLNMNVNGTEATPTNVTNQVYRPVYHHWFYKKEIEGKVVWQQFSMVDSLALDQAFTSNDLDPDRVVATDGGRFDVNILRRQRIPVYWKETETEVRRCSWFHKGNADGKFVPYEENIATKLEDEYKNAFELNEWHRKVELPNGETVVFHSPDVLVLFPPTQSPDAWGNTPNQMRPRVVKRGMDEFDIDEGEPAKVDHLLFLVHGIGSVCDLKFRSVEEVVNEFRSIALQLVQSHYRSSCDHGIANRIEVLPISWHDELHSEDTGIDKKLKSITLTSIPRLRDFTNDTLLDVLFYTSPVYCQTVISTVGNQLNKIFELFKQRNPTFNGGVSLGGHSLGSLILFDLLCHQHPEVERESPSNDEDVVAPLTKPPPLQRRMSRRISYMMGTVGTGQPQIQYPHLNFQPENFFALGSPIGMFVTVRGLDNLGEQFALPTCPAFFNIFHPYDPVAYRVESLINPELGKLKPVLIPHHKGRKRMHLELKETMARVGADLKQRVVDSMKNTWSSFYQLAMFHRQNPPSLEEEVDKAFKGQIRETEEIDEEPEQTDLPLGLLNKNRRIDYVLQEAPHEFFNEYIFALSSHVCYWESEDTMLLMLKEIYSSMDISADDKIPQQSMTIERPPASPKLSRSPASAIGTDPTLPMHQPSNLGPPPTSGFVKKT